MSEPTPDTSPQSWEEVVVTPFPVPLEPVFYVEHLLIWRSHMLDLCCIPSDLLDSESSSSSRLAAKGFSDVHHQPD